MELLELIANARSRGISYDELVEKSGMARAAVGVEVMHLISVGKIERSDGLYFAPLRRTPNETPSTAATIEEGDRMENTKRCPRCKQIKPADQFRSNGYCRPCGKQYDDDRAKAKSAPTTTAAASQPGVAANRATVARPEPKVAPAAPLTPSIEDRFKRQAEARSAPSATASATVRQQIAREAEKLLLPSRQRIAAAIEERDGEQIVQIASDSQTVIEATPEQMDAICGWWAKIRTA